MHITANKCFLIGRRTHLDSAKRFGSLCEYHFAKKGVHRFPMIIYSNNLHLLNEQRLKNCFSIMLNFPPIQNKDYICIIHTNHRQERPVYWFRIAPFRNQCLWFWTLWSLFCMHLLPARTNNLNRNKFFKQPRLYLSGSKNFNKLISFLKTNKTWLKRRTKRIY